jgi:hypothetical protein
MNNQQFYKKIEVKYTFTGWAAILDSNLTSPKGNIFQKSNFHKSSVEFNNS